MNSLSFFVTTILTGTGAGLIFYTRKLKQNTKELEKIEPYHVNRAPGICYVRGRLESKSPLELDLSTESKQFGIVQMITTCTTTKMEMNYKFPQISKKEEKIRFVQ